MRPEFMIERNGKTFCLYAGLLDEAHNQGLKAIRTTLVQIPTDENGFVAICRSEVETDRGLFTGLGDASSHNVARAMATCLIRMAETRAKARALRDAVNVGVVALEELPPETSDSENEESASFTRPPARSTETPNDYSRSGPRPVAASRIATSPPTVRGNGSHIEDPGSGDGITPAQRRMLESLSRQLGESVAVDGLSRREASLKITDMKNRLVQPKAA